MIFFFFQYLLEIDCTLLNPVIEVVLTMTHNLCFEQKVRKMMYTPVNLSIIIQKLGLRVSKLPRPVSIRITHLCNLHPFTPHFYIASIAQWLECRPFNSAVVRSSPGPGRTYMCLPC